MTRVGWRRTSAGLTIGVCLLALACGTLHSPTEPKPAPEKNSQSNPPDPSGVPAPVFGGPAASPSPSPSADPGAQATPPPATGEGSGECGEPLPPPVTSIGVKVHIRGTENWILDSTPLVGPDLEYCRKIGFTDNRSVCPVRPEGNPQRSACELYAIGRAKDTNRPGPTWYLDGHFCTGRASGCENNGDNQYLLNTYRGGTFRACANNGVCGEVEVDR
ncbi:MAG: hypothetical protein ACM3PV_11035 [Betaproteobacteria bacterium]